MTAVDLWCTLIDMTEDMRRAHEIDGNQCEVIIADLRQAMWHSGNPYNTKQALCGVAHKFGLPIPEMEQADE